MWLESVKQTSAWRVRNKKTHLENEHMNNLKIHKKRKVKKKTCGWRVTTKTCLESEYI